MIRPNRSHYRWYILTLTMLTFAVIVGAQRMCMPVLFKEISIDLNLSLVSIGTIWGMDPLAGVLVGLPGGLLIDRFGVKRTLVVLCLAAGLFSALRGLSVNFSSMATTMFFFGLIAAVLPGISPKVTAVWFGGRHLGLANALVYIAWSVGAMVGSMFSATVFSPWLGGWRNVMFLYSIPAIILGLLWLTAGREPGKSELATTGIKAVPFQQALSRVLRIKEVWILGLVQAAYWGSYTGLSGYLALYLRDIGWTPVSADSMLTALNGVNCVGTIPMVLLSNRLRSRKIVLILSLAVMVASLALLPLTRGPAIWPLLLIAGLLRSGTGPLINTMIFEIKGINSTYGGTAAGLANAIGMLGAFISPPSGNSFSAINPGLPFIFWAFLAALALPLLFLFKEHRLTRYEEG